MSVNCLNWRPWVGAHCFETFKREERLACMHSSIPGLRCGAIGWNTLPSLFFWKCDWYGWKIQLVTKEIIRRQDPNADADALHNCLEWRANALSQGHLPMLLHLNALHLSFKLAFITDTTVKFSKMSGGMYQCVQRIKWRNRVYPDFCILEEDWSNFILWWFTSFWFSSTSFRTQLCIVFKYSENKLYLVRALGSNPKIFTFWSLCNVKNMKFCRQLTFSRLRLFLWMWTKVRTQSPRSSQGWITSETWLYNSVTIVLNTIPSMSAEM